MPSPGKRWRFVTFSTKCNWLPGDERGWRSRGHKRHSSGDYKKPPPLEEREGLREWVNDRAGPRMVIPEELRDVIGSWLVHVLTELDHRVLGVSVSGCHAHILVELPLNMALIRAIVGEMKRVSSRAVRDDMPGTVWAAGGDYELVESRQHQRNVLNYILTKQGPKAWTWSFREAMPEVEIRKRAKRP